MKSLKLCNSLIFGKVAFNDCFIAATAVLIRRSVFKFFRSECSHKMGVISLMPISVHFSINHSNRSLFFVGAMAMCKLGLVVTSLLVFTIFTSHFFGWLATITAS